MKNIKYIFPAIIILFTVFCSSAFAVSAYTMPDEPNTDGYRVCFFDSSENTYYFYRCQKPFRYDSKDGVYRTTTSLHHYVSLYTFNPSTDSDWVLVADNKTDCYFTEPRDLIYSSHDITDYYDSSVVFFSATAMNPYYRTVVREAPKVLTQILKILPIIAACLVGFLALRKAWEILLRVLRTA